MVRYKSYLEWTELVVYEPGKKTVFKIQRHFRVSSKFKDILELVQNSKTF